MDEDRSQRLAKAAEELVKAACTEVEVASLQIGRDAIDGLKKISEDSASLKESVDRKLNTLNQHLSDIKDVMNKNANELKQQLAAGEKQRSLEWAIANAHLNSFEYYDGYKEGVSYYEYRSKKESKDLVVTVLFRFKKGLGTYIDSCYVLDGKRDPDLATFREKLKNQIHELTGVKPRLEKDQGKWAIWYA